MWIDLYPAAAVIVAVVAWLVSPHFQSDDPPGDLTRGFWSAAAGVLWPLILVGVVQLYAVRYIAQRLRPADSQEPELAPVGALHDVGAHI